MIKKVKVEKDLLYWNHPIVPIRDIDNNDVEYTINNNKIACINKYCDKFERVLNENFSKESLKNFYFNINSLKVTKGGYELKKLKARNPDYCAASYNIYENGIYLFVKKKYIEKVIYHELFHLASSSKTKDMNILIINCGFADILQRMGGYTLSKGIAITEGYTELLAQRYFDDDDYERKISVYPFENRLSYSLEKIISKENMENHYLKSDSLSFMKDLKKYSHVDEIVKLYDESDFLFDYKYHGEEKDYNRAMISFNYINDYLISTYKNKIDDELYCGNFQESDANKYILNYIKSMPLLLHIAKRNLYCYEAGHADRLYQKYKY